MTIRSKNQIVDSINPATGSAYMQALTTADLLNFQGIEGPAEDARIAHIEIDGIGAEMVLCESALQIHLFTDEELVCFDYPQERRQVRELMAKGVLDLADLGLDFEDLERLGWERVV